MKTLDSGWTGAIRRKRGWILAVMAVVPPTEAWAQGVVQFSTRDPARGVVAPVYGPQVCCPWQGMTGNATTNGGAVNYTGTPLAGTNYTAELWGGPASATDAQLLPLAQTTFRTGAVAGFVAAAPNVVVPNIPAGTQARLQLRAWDNMGGTVTNWAQAECQSWFGRSASFVSQPLGTAGAPSSLAGLTSFNIYTPLTPSFYYTVSVGSNYMRTVDGKYSGLTAYVLAGEGVTLGVGDTFPAPPPYVWQRNGTNIPGAANGQLVLPSVQLADTGAYRVEEGAGDNCFGSFAMNLVVVQPRLSEPVWYPSVGGGLRVRLDAVPNRRAVMEVSSNLVSWAPWLTGQLNSATVEFATGLPLPPGPRFYRAVISTSP